MPADGSALELNHVRRGSGEPLVLLHSLGGTISQWNPVIDRLAKRRDVIAVEMPGFGSSPLLPPAIEPTAGNLAAAVLEFIGTLGLGRKPGVAGISLGSWVAIECARRGGVAAAVALCPAGFWREPLPPRRNTAYATARAIRPLVPLLTRIEPIRSRALAISVRHPERVPLADAIELFRGYGRAEGYAASNHHMRANTVGDLSELEVPLTLAWAEFDQLVRNRPLPPETLPEGVRQVTLPGCGHLPTWDEPELVASVILEGTGSAAERRAGA